MSEGGARRHAPGDGPLERHAPTPPDAGGSADVGDRPAAVRGEDAFDVAAAADWLRANAPEAMRGALVGTPEVQQFAGGASNLTYLLRYPELDLILRRPPSGTKSKGAHDMRREHDVQAALRPVFPLVPAMVGYCGDESVIGSEFYVMERIPGIILRKNLPAGLDLDEPTVRTLCLAAIDTLAGLHSVDVASSGLAPFGKGEGYVTRQVAGWSKRYRAARTKGVRHGVGSFEKVMRWLEANQPADVANCLIHNDFRFDNLVLDEADPTRVVGVLDWEMATLGDPLMDLGSALAYWVQSDDPKWFRGFRRQPTHLPGMLTREQVVAAYAERTGRTVTPEQWTFYEVFGLFRLAAIVQQIYYRYANGQTTNPAFKEFRLAVILLEWRCRRLIRARG